MNKSPTIMQQAQMAEQLSAQYAKAIDGTREILLFGAMMISLGRMLDVHYTRGEDGQIVDKDGGVRGWVEAHCPDINYYTAYGFYRLARGLVDTLELPKTADIQRLLLAAPGDLSGKDAKARERIDEAISGKTKTQLEFDFNIRKTPGKVGAPAGNQNARKDPSLAGDYEFQKLMAERETGRPLDKLGRMIDSNSVAILGLIGLRTLAEELERLAAKTRQILKEVGEKKSRG